MAETGAASCASAAFARRSGASSDELWSKEGSVEPSCEDSTGAEALASGAFLRFAAAFTVSFRARLVVRPSSEAASAKSDDGCAFVVLLLPPGRASSSDEVAALPRFLDRTAFEDGFAG